jgi:hypothetical protein
MPIRRLLVLPVFASVAALLVVTHAATAQSASGTITGRVVWGACIRGIPLPAQPNDQGGAPAAPDAQVQPQPIAPANGLPAGAVLVAVQGTAVSARTDEAGRFSLSGVPAGTYLTVAAGPVANATNAVAERPNVFVNGGQSTDVGTLNLGGGQGSVGFPCRVLPGVQSVPGTDTEPSPPMPDQTPTGP